MKRIDRSDLLSALNEQLKVRAGDVEQKETSAALMLKTVLSPVIDISHPSKIPYGDWYAGSGVGDVDILAPARVGYRFVITHMSLSIAKTAADTGTQASIQSTIKGVGGRKILQIVSITLTANQQTVVATSAGIVTDSNVNVLLSVTGSHTTVAAHVTGYYIVG